MTASQYIAAIQERRRANLQRLVEKVGEQTEVARQAGMTQPQISNILAGRLTMSEFRARKAEQFLGLGYGALDLELP